MRSEELVTQHPSRPCQVRSLHRVTYENGVALQETLVAMRQRESVPDQLLLLEHPPVITIGRGGDIRNLLVSAEQLKQRGIRFFETGRGGDITFHGPGQLVGYPIIHLGEGNRDVRKYVTRLEEMLIRTVAELGISATRIDGKHGIWVGNDKLAAIGVRIARWVTSHGFALNVDPDLDSFGLITPCGLNDSGVTSIARLTGSSPSMEEVRTILIRHFSDLFARDLQTKAETLRLVKVVVHDGDRVLLLHRKPQRGDFWQPVTGTIEEGESDHGAAKRELLEETGSGLDPVPAGLTQSFMIESSFLADRYEAPVVASEVLYSAQLSRNTPLRIDPEEHDDLGWFTFREAYEKIRWSDDRDALELIERKVATSP